MDSDLTPIDELDHDILDLCTRINATTYELLVLVREFDERAGWLQWGLDNCTEWLAWRCDLGLSAAREKVRVAHALKFLPRISALFRTGELSYSKVRHLTRVANEDNEDRLVAFALRHTAVVVAERCRELRCGTALSNDVAARAFERRALRINRDRDRNVMTITVELPMDAGELVEKALDKARDDEVLKIPDLADTSWSTRQADAFVAMVSGYLSGNSDVSGDNYRVTIHVDQSALAGGDGRSAIPIESVKRHCCDGKAVVITETSGGEPLAIGRKSRVIPKAIERAVRARDNNCCRFPGCNNRRFLHCHHVEHWANGGDTAMNNLILLCTKHHALVHEGGYRIEKDFLDNWCFVRPDGLGIPDSGYISGAYKNATAVALLSVAENSVSERPPPGYWH